MSSMSEHVISLVSRLQDQASAGFVAMATNATRALEQIERAEHGAAAAAKQEEQAFVAAGAAAEGSSTAAAAAIGGAIGVVAVIAFQKATEALTELITSIPELAREATGVQSFAQQLGISTDEMQRFAFLAERFDVPLAGMASGFRMLARHISDNDRTLQTLGIATTDVNGHLRSTDAVLADLADRFHDTTDETAKMAVAEIELGRSGAQLIPMLNQGAEALHAMGNEAERAGRFLDSETLAKLHAIDLTLRDLKEKWEATEIKIKVAFVTSLDRLVNPGGAGPTQEEIENAAWTRAKITASEQLYGHGYMPGAPQEERTKVALLAADMMAAAEMKTAQASAKAADEMQAAADAARRQKSEAEKLDAAVASLQERLTSSDMGRAQIDALAEGYNRGTQSIRSLLEELNTPAAVEKVIDRARFLVGLMDEYGASWKGADFFTRAQTDHLGTTEDKLRAVNAAMLKMLEISKDETKEIEKQQLARIAEVAKGAHDRARGALTVGPLAADLGTSTPLDQGADARVFEFFGQIHDEANDMGAMWTHVLEGMTQDLDSQASRWADKLVAFDGIWGDLMRTMLTEWIRTMERMAATWLFNLVTSFGGGAAAAAGGAGAGIGMGTSVGFSLPGFTPSRGRGQALNDGAASDSRRIAGSVPRGTTVELHVSTLDARSFRDSMDSPFGTVRQAFESAFESGAD